MSSLTVQALGVDRVEHGDSAAGHYAGFASPMAVVTTFVGCLCCALSRVGAAASPSMTLGPCVAASR